MGGGEGDLGVTEIEREARIRVSKENGKDDHGTIDIPFALRRYDVSKTKFLIDFFHTQVDRVIAEVLRAHSVDVDSRWHPGNASNFRFGITPPGLAFSRSVRVSS